MVPSSAGGPGCFASPFLVPLALRRRGGFRWPGPVGAAPFSAALIGGVLVVGIAAAAAVCASSLMPLVVGTWFVLAWLGVVVPFLAAPFGVAILVSLAASSAAWTSLLVPPNGGAWCLLAVLRALALSLGVLTVPIPALRRTTTVLRKEVEEEPETRKREGT